MKKTKSKLPHIYLNMISDDIQTAAIENGFSLFKNIMIVWDEGDKKDVLSFVDKIPEKVREKLLLVFQYRGTIDMIWKEKVPQSYQGNTVLVGSERCTVFSSAYVIKVV